MHRQPPISRVDSPAVSSTGPSIAKCQAPAGRGLTGRSPGEFSRLPPCTNIDRRTIATLRIFFFSRHMLAAQHGVELRHRAAGGASPLIIYRIAKELRPPPAGGPLKVPLPSGRRVIKVRADCNFFPRFTHQRCRICAYAHISQRLQHHCKPSAIAVSACQPVTCVITPRMTLKFHVVTCVHQKSH